MWLKWFPWRWVISRVARARGLLDPVKVLSRLESFAQPLEVKEPLELLRAGMVFHARGLINTSAIQHNLDWIWPFWVERQYDPEDVAFIPRAFSVTHVNLTHRNWTAVGVPGWDELPIVDPRGLLTPFWDSWSLDAWIFTGDGRRLVPSRLREVDQGEVDQVPDLSRGWALATCSREGGLALASRAEVEETAGRQVPTCRLELEAVSDVPGWLVVALRPYNPEGVSFVHDLELLAEDRGWRVNGRRDVHFGEPPERHRFSYYRAGDVAARLPEPGEERSVHCRVGMATAAALYALEPGRRRRLAVEVPLIEERPASTAHAPNRASWPETLAAAARLQVADRRCQLLYDAAVRTLVLCSPGEVYPGPYTYKRFWFRDAAFMLHALLAVGLSRRVEPVLDSFPHRQTGLGFFRSQDGEWDSNGEALWIFHRFCRLTGRPPKPGWEGAIRRGVRWIERKRTSLKPGFLHSGLLPPGFSAEHLGPNDYYYWDDFWGVAGLEAAAALLAGLGDGRQAGELRRQAREFLAVIEGSLARVAERSGEEGMPASPYRRMDSGAIGSLAAGYPLELFDPRDPRLLATADFLMEHCRVQGGFFQDIIHSGINPYLTLHLAQVLLRAGDPRCLELARTVARTASSTGQWPEAVHPRTGGGCMGDGHHAWAAAEWVLYLRNAFVREEGEGLVLASGVDPDWRAGGESCSFGPAPTPFGPVTVALRARDEGTVVEWQGDWRGEAPAVTVHLPGREPVAAVPGQKRLVLEPVVALS